MDDAPVRSLGEADGDDDPVADDPLRLPGADDDEGLHGGGVEERRQPRLVGAQSVHSGPDPTVSTSVVVVSIALPLRAGIPVPAHHTAPTGAFEAVHGTGTPLWPSP